MKQLRIGQQPARYKAKQENNISESMAFVSRFYKEKEPFFVRSGLNRYAFSSKYLESYLNEFISKEKNTYISVGSAKKVKERATIDNVKSLKMIVIDLDNHNNTQPNNIEQSIKAMESMGLYDYVPKPHFVVMSGRGIQMVYAIDNITLAKKKDSYIAMYKDTIRILQKSFIKALEELSDFNYCNLEVDSKVSAVSQLIRLPGTYNEKAKTMAKIVRDYSEIEDYNVSNLIFKYKEYEEVETNKKVGFDTEYKALLKARVSDMFKLQEVRFNEYNEIGHRQSMLSNYLYCVLSVNSSITEHELEKKATIYNLGFRNPLKDSEVQSTVRGAMPYKERNPKISNDSMINFLNITNEEGKHMSTLGKSEKEKQRIINEKKMDRIRKAKLQSRAYTKVNNYKDRIKLIELVRKDREQMNINELANKYGLSEKTIKNYLKDDYINKLAKPTKEEYKLHEKESERLLIKKTKKKA
ncbi:helix-turn-helix domain-containing protein [Erysipelothrix rhusiopathiae]|nr:helix-turn-helix domain-containing protein [Erysipelothrix rhusiopathiae]MDE8182345.1 helix-turn-helix domain-containing protein [Erysipelothrix rhusiopathiae]